MSQVPTPKEVNSADKYDIEGFLLTRQWRDARHMSNSQGKGDIDLSFWAATNKGPLRLSIPSQAAVCFIEREHPQTEQLQSPRVSRKTVDLSLMDGGPVDALYFKQQRDLLDARDFGIPLHESDVKPADRYLMERFVHAGFRARGPILQRDGFLEILNPQLKPSDFEPSLRALSLDIETRAHTNRLYSIGASTGDANVVFMLDESVTDRVSETRELELSHRKQVLPYQLVRKRSEKELLIAFFDWLQLQDPDVIIGWNIVNFDLAFLHRLCNELHLPFAFARGGEQATVLQPSRNASGGPGGMRIARIPGRPVLDGVDLLRAGFWSFESFALDNVASELLGTRKLISGDKDKIAEINHLFQNDKPALADYNLLDCLLVHDIFNQADLLPFAIQRAAITGLAIDRMGGSVAAFDHLYLPRLHRAGFVAPNTMGRPNEDGSPGGYVMDSIPGLYDNVLVLDFKSLYPSIIRTFKIDPLGLALGNQAVGGQSNSRATSSDNSEMLERHIPGFNDAWFAREDAILPDLIEDLWKKRDVAKQNNDRAMSQAIKIIMNSFYGVLGSSGCRFHKQQLASSITRRGHEIITRSQEFIETAGYKVIYGDTDSLFVLLGADVDETAAADTGKELMDSLNQWWQATLRHEYNIDSALEVEYETHYLKFLMPTVRGMSTGSKKRYAGMVRDKNNQFSLVFKGLEAVRTDWTPLARNFQRELYRRIFQQQPYEEFVRTTASQLMAGQLDAELVYRKRLRRKLSDYKKNVPPHVQAARKMQKPGHWISYIITCGGPEPVSELASAPDYEHYLEKQLAPAADGILYFMDTSFSSINDGQMEMF